MQDLEKRSNKSSWSGEHPSGGGGGAALFLSLKGDVRGSRGKVNQLTRDLTFRKRH